MNKASHERLGVDVERLRAVIDCFGPIAGSREEGFDPAFGRSSRTMAGMQVTLARYLLGDWEGSRSEAGRVVEGAVDYLFGKWREGYAVLRWVQDGSRAEGGYQRRVVLGREGCRRELGWEETFRDGLCCALAMGRGEAAGRIAGYPEGGGVFEEGEIGTLMGRVVRGEFRGWEEEAGRVRGKRERRLLAAMVAIRRGDAGGFGKALVECLRHHGRGAAASRGIDEKLDLDATVLYHAARRQGMEAGVGEDLGVFLLRYE